MFVGKFDQGDRVISLVSVIHESHRLMVNRSYLYSNLYLYTRYTYIDAPKKFYSKVCNKCVHNVPLWQLHSHAMHDRSHCYTMTT